MSNVVGSSDTVTADVVRGGSVPPEQLLIKGVYDIEHVRDGKVLSRQRCSNIVTTQGKNYLLSAGIANGTAKTTWYVALISSNTAAAAGMTYATPTYTETSSYSESNRVTYVETVTDNVCTNSASKATFTSNATQTIYGASLVSNNTKGDTAASGEKLMSYSLFSSPINVVSGDTINVTISITLS